ncbi:Sodium:alanine symporter, partial [human gut metagenome]
MICLGSSPDRADPCGWHISDDPSAGTSDHEAAACGQTHYCNEKDGKDGEVSSFGALCTALSATIGTGNIVGVATAVVAGGPGALFWMWIAALFGTATKYAECLLAIKYRVVEADG